MKTLILTPNKTEMCGMYQLAKDLAKEFDGDIGILYWENRINRLVSIGIDKFLLITTKEKIRDIDGYYALQLYDRVITLIHPMHLIGKKLQKRYCIEWIVYNQGIPPITKTYFPNFWRRQAMRYINWRNNATMKGADEYWDVTEREQKPRWTKKSKVHIYWRGGYAIYLGRRTDYKNFNWLDILMKQLKIPLMCSNDWSDNEVYNSLSGSKMLVTASLWEGYGRPVMEAEALGIPAVAYDVGSHKRHIKKGICVPLDINDMKKSEEMFRKAIVEVWNR